jgi:hypothetical protein
MPECADYSNRTIDVYTAMSETWLDGRILKPKRRKKRLRFKALSQHFLGRSEENNGTPSHRENRRYLAEIWTGCLFNVLITLVPSVTNHGENSETINIRTERKSCSLIQGLLDSQRHRTRVWSWINWDQLFVNLDARFHTPDRLQARVKIRLLTAWNDY